MKSFIWPRFYCQILGVIPWEKHSPTKMALQNLFFLMLFGQYLICALGSLFVEAETPEKFARTAFFCGSSVLDVWMYLVLVVNKGKIKDILDEMEEFLEHAIRTSKFKHHYIKCDDLCVRWLHRACLSFDILCIFTLMLPNVIIYVAHRSDTRFLEEEFLLPFPMVLPYDYRKPLGYALAIFEQDLMCNGTTLVLTRMVAQFVTFSMFFEAIGKDLNDRLRHWDSEFATQPADRLAMKNGLVDIVKLHVDSHRLVDGFSLSTGTAISAIMFGMLIWNCCGLLYIAITNDYLIAIIMAILLVFAYVLCHFGDNVDVQFDSFNVAINQTCWYEYPLEFQKHLLVVQAIALRPVLIRGFPNLEFDRPFFQRFIRASYSYFNILRQARR